MNKTCTKNSPSQNPLFNHDEKDLLHDIMCNVSNEFKVTFFNDIYMNIPLA